MQVSFKRNKLEKQCTDDREIRRAFPKFEKKLRLRISALRAADSLGDLPANDPNGTWHEVDSEGRGTWSGELSGNWRILVLPSPIKSLGATEVTVMEIKDYH